LALPMAVHFLAVEKWRPREGRLLWPGPEQRGPIVAFAREQIAGGLVQSIRSVAESVVLTNTLGVATFGLVNRALALYQSTIGRVGSVFLDAAYPLLPLEREDHVRYRQRASRFVQVGLILSVPGAAFLVLEGAHVSRLLFGDTWIEADPYLAPAAVALAAGTLATSASYVLLGAGRVRSSVLAESLVAVGALAALSTTLVTTVTSHYMWVFAGVHVVAAVVAVAMATPLLESSWLREGLWPSVSASVAAMVVVMALRASTALEGPLGVAVSAALFAGSASIVVALTAPAVVREVLRTHRALAFRSSVAPSQAEA
jgi:O-antigen/teichoic acid export membrane protein